MKPFIISLIVFGICSQLYGQNYERGLSSESIEKVDSLWNVYKMAKHDTIRIKLLIEKMGKIYESINPDSAILLYNKAIVLTDKNLISPFVTTQTLHELMLYKSSSLRNIGLVHYLQGNYNKAIEFYLKSLKVNEELNGKERISDDYIHIGNFHYLLGNYDSANEFYFKALKINEEINDKEGMSSCYLNIGCVYYSQKSYSKAMEFYFKSLKIKEELGDKKGMSDGYLNIGTIYYSQNNLDKANEFYLKALKIEEESGDKKGMSESYSNIGNIYHSKGNYHKAIELFIKALKIKEELNDKEGMVYCYASIGSMYISLADSSTFNKSIRLNCLNQAIEYGTKAMALANEIKATSSKNTASQTLMLAYKKLGDFEKSLEYAEIFIVTNDSIFSEEKIKAITEMGTKYETQKKEEKIKLLNKEKQLEKTKRTFLIYITILIIILTAIIIIFLVVKNRKNRQLFLMQKALKEAEINSLQNELLHNHQKLDDFTGRILSKNKLIDELQQKLNELPRSGINLSQEQQEQLQILCHLKILTEDSWNEFKKYYDKVFPGQINTLQINYPELTTAELRIFLLIKLNIDTKDIADMLGISIESVRKSKYRLKKKLQLKEDMSLDEYIQNV